MTSRGSRFLRADAVAVLEPSLDRVGPPCPHAGPGRCGGCDWQHASLAAQRAGKAAVVAEQLHRLAGLDVEVDVQPLPGAADGLGWRTRVRYAVDADGVPGLRRHRSHEIEPGVDCLLAAPGVRGIGVPGLRWPGVTEIEAVASGTGDRALVLHPAGPDGPALPDGLPADVAVGQAGPDGTVRVRGRSYVVESALGRRWRVDAAGFWQVHPAAADTLAAAVLDGLGAEPAHRVVDLYAGVGLFAAAAAEVVGPDGSVLAVESDARAVADARRNLHDLPTVRLVHDRVDHALADGAVRGADRVVLDPPRSGAGLGVVGRIGEAAVPRVVYVACDPAALARDVAGFAGHGYRLESVRAFDMFPMTHHVECVATLSLVS